MRKLFAVCAGLAALGVCLSASTAQAGLVTWTINTASSTIKLTIPNQTVSISSIGSTVLNANYALKAVNNGNTSNWTTGNISHVTGTIASSFNGLTPSTPFGTNIAFATNQSGIAGIASGNWNPNDATWNGTNFGSGSAPGEFGLGLETTNALGFLTVLLYKVNLQNAGYELNSSQYAGGVIPVSGGGTFASNNLVYGVSSGQFDLAGQAVVGTTLPSDQVIITPSSGFTLTNSGGTNAQLTATPTGPNSENLMLTVPILVPISYEITPGVFATMTISGTIVANASNVSLIPEPASILLALVGAGGVAMFAIRKRRRK